MLHIKETSDRINHKNSPNLGHHVQCIEQAVHTQGYSPRCNQLHEVALYCMSFPHFLSLAKKYTQKNNTPNLFAGCDLLSIWSLPVCVCVLHTLGKSQTHWLHVQVEAKCFFSLLCTKKERLMALEAWAASLASPSFSILSSSLMSLAGSCWADMSPSRVQLSL